MRKFKVWVSTGFVGSEREVIIEVDDEATEEEIYEYCADVIENMIESGWYEIYD